MLDQALIWNTDSKLQVTSLTARLRDFARVGGTDRPITVGDLWGHEDPFGIAVVAHHWALQGEAIAFEAPIRGATYCFELEPLTDGSSSVVGVSGRANPLGDRDARLRADVLGASERSAGVGTWVEDLRTGLFTISDGLAALLGVDRSVRNLDLRRFDHPDERNRTAAAIGASMREDNAYTHDHRTLCEDGRSRCVRERLRTLYDDRGLAYARIGTLADITEFKLREAELAELAHYDPLTQLPNRALIEERLASSITRCRRHELRCALLFIDLDDFKRVNDTYGHAAGDRLLNRVGQHLSHYVRSSDTVGRLGGDEFIVILEDLMSDEAALDAGRTILQSFDQPFIVYDREISISASIGIAVSPRCSLSPGELLACADREMYAVKRNGGRGVKLAAAIRQDTPHISDEMLACAARSLPDQHRFASPASA